MKKNVLLLEDDSFITQMYVAKMEEELDIEVTTFANPLEAQKFMNETDIKFDLFLYDLILPDLDGYGMLAWTKQNEKVKDVPIVILSNLSAQKDINDAYEMGAIDYIVKSNYTPNEVMRTIRKHLPKD